MATNRSADGQAATPDEIPTERAGMHNDKIYEHPAFGNIHASRVSTSHGVNLLGSDFPHTHFVTITISEAELVRSGLSYDRIHSGKQLISVALSEAQWATFVSSLNAGGSACTLETVMGETRPGIPARKKVDVAKGEMVAKVSGLVAEIDAAIAAVDGEIGKSLSMVKRKEIMGHLTKLRNTVGAGLPWVSKMFAEEMEQTVERAKIEVNAYMTSQIHSAGLAAIGAAAGGPLLIDKGTAKDSE